MSLARLVLFVSIAGLLPQEKPAPQPPPQSQSGVIVPQQDNVIRRRIDLVTADVIVRDGNGQFIADLEERNSKSSKTTSNRR